MKSFPHFLANVTNLDLVRVNFSSLVEGTPVEGLWRSGAVQECRFALNNIR